MHHRHLFQCILTAFALVSGAAGAAESQRFEEGGVAIEFGFDQQSQAGSALVQFAIRDAASGRVLPNTQPAAWMMARRSEQVAGELSCNDKADQLSIGSLGMRADVDMNTYRLVTLNQDNTLAFINPLVSLKKSKLESIVQLPGTGYDWVYSPRLRRLVVSLREEGTLVVIDTVKRQITATLPMGEGSLPTRLVLDPDGNRVWVGLDGRSEIALINLNGSENTARIAVGRGLHTIVADADTPWLFVTNSQDNTVTLIDRSNLKPTAYVVVSDTPVAAAWSIAAKRLVVIGINGGRLELVDPVKSAVSAQMSLARGITTLGLFDGGRYALVANQLTNDVSLIDLAAPKVLDSLKVAGKPDQIALSGGYAYVRSQSSTQLHVINLAQAKLGKLQSVIVPMGQRAPHDAPAAINDAASVLVSAPEGNGILLANPADGYIYRYVEGMMAPVGSFSNYRRQARALRVLDDRLNVYDPGHYQATVRVPRSGHYDVIVRNLRPAITACFTVTADVESGTLPLVAAAPIPLLLSTYSLAGDKLAVEFSLQSAGKEAISGVQDAVVLGIQRSGQWQGRSQAQSIEGGRYMAIFSGIPAAAEIELLVQIPSKEVWFSQGRIGRVRWPLNNSVVQGTDINVAAGRRDATH